MIPLINISIVAQDVPNMTGNINADVIQIRRYRSLIKKSDFY